MSKSALLSEGLVNHYGALPVEDLEDVADDSSETSNASASECSECDAVITPHCDGSGLDVFLVDDDLGRAMEVTATIQVSCPGDSPDMTDSTSVLKILSTLSSDAGRLPGTVKSPLSLLPL